MCLRHHQGGHFVGPYDHDGPITTRQKLAQHAMMPPALVAIPLWIRWVCPREFYALGVWRTTENGLPIDARGEVNGQTFTGESPGGLNRSRERFR